VTCFETYIGVEITSHEDRQSTAETGGQVITEFRSQAKPSQAKPSQAKPSQAKPKF